MATPPSALPLLERIDPASVKADRDRLYEEARAQIERDYPEARFALPVPPADVAGTAGTPGEPAPMLKPQVFVVGQGKPRQVKELTPEQDNSWWHWIAQGAKAGAAQIGLIDDSLALRAADEVASLSDEEAKKKVESTLSLPSFRGGPVAIPARVRKRLEKGFGAPKAERDAAVAKARTNIEALQEEIATLRPKGDDFWKNAAFDAASSVVFMAPALGAGVVSGNAAVTLGTIGLMTYYTGYGQHRAAGADPARANILAATDGLVESLTELFPTAKLLSKLPFLKKAIWSIIADIPGEQVANFVQSATAAAAELPSDATNDQLLGAIRAGAYNAVQQAGSVAATTVMAGGVQAGAVAGIQRLAGVQAEQPAPPPPAAPGTTPPAAAPTPAPQPSAAPAASPAAPAASPAVGTGIPKKGEATIFKPTQAPGVVVEVLDVNPQSQSATVVRLDEATGEPAVDDEGNPVSFVASFSDLQAPEAVPTPQAQPAAPAPSQTPPSATTTEPTSDIAGQIKDMWKSNTARRGVYLSPATVAKMKSEGTYEQATKAGQVAENFDGDGGTLIVKSKKDMEEAVAARDSGQTDMQAIVGALTGAGVKKPDIAKPAVVQRKDETGAVVQQTAVEPEQVPAVVEEVAKQPGTVEVVTPEQALAEREAKVAQEQVAAAKQRGGGPVFEGLDAAVQFAQTQLDTPKAIGSVKTDVREGAQAVQAAAMALRQAVGEAQKRGATDDQVAEAAKAAKAAERIGQKPEKDFVKGRGVSERILRDRLDAIRAAAEGLESFRAAKRTAPVEAPKAEKAKKVSKKRSKPAEVPAQVEEPAKAEVVPIEPKLVAKEEAEDKQLIEYQRRAQASKRLERVHAATSELERLRSANPVADVQIDSRIKKIHEFMDKAEAAAQANDLNALDAAAQNIEFLANEAIELVKALPAPEKVVSRKKHKYVPPTKKTRTITAEQAEQMAVENATATEVPTLEFAPSAPAGQEVELTSLLLGAQGSELIAEVTADESGRLRQNLELIVNAVGNRGNWGGWWSALMNRPDVLQRTQRNHLLALIGNYRSAASTAELEEIRDQITDLLSNLEQDGKRVAAPKEAVSAVFEAAAIARTYTLLRLELENADDFNTLLDETHAEEFDKHGLVEGGGVAVVRENEIGGVGRTKDVERTEAAVTANQEAVAWLLRTIRGQGSFKQSFMNSLRAISDDLINTPAFMSMLDRAVANPGQNLPGAKDVMYFIIKSAQKTSQMSTNLVQVLSAIHNALPNTPVEFTLDRLSPIPGEHSVSDRVRGRYSARPNILRMSVTTFFANGPVRFSPSDVSTFIHEAVHAATLLELTRNPDSLLNKELEQLRQEILVKARAKYGTVVDSAVSKAGTEKDMSDAERSMFNVVYGLVDTAEMLAEIFSNPAFHTFLVTLDQTSPTKSWWRTKFNGVIRAIAHMLGIRNPAQRNLIGEIMTLGLRTMTLQRARAARGQKLMQRIAPEIARTLGLSIDDALTIIQRYNMNAIGASESLLQTMAVGARDTGTSTKMEILSQRGMGVKQRLVDGRGSSTYQALLSTQLMHRAYGLTVEQQTRALQELRAEAVEGELMKSAPHLYSKDLERVTTPGIAQTVGVLNRLMRSRSVAKVRETIPGLFTTDFIVRRGGRAFGNPNDPLNPLTAWKHVRDTRRTFANQLMELAEKTVNSKWLKLSLTESEQLGDVLQHSTLWQIDPELDATQPMRVRRGSKKAWAAKVAELNEMWRKLSPEQKDIYRSVQKYFKQEYNKIRLAGVNLAIDAFGATLTQQQRTLLVAAKTPETIDKLVGVGKPIDIGESSEPFKRLLMDMIKVTSIEGPYFPLFRKGKFVVEAAREGTLAEDNGEPQIFTSKEDAEQAATDIRTMAPKNVAKVKEAANGFVVSYRIRNVSFHESEQEAIDAIEELRKQGFDAEGGVYTRKLEEIQSASLTEGMKNLIAKAESIAGHKDEAIKTLESAFVQILAERAASASQQIKRQGVAGFKGKEAHETFSRRVRASSWHYANLRTSLDQSKTLRRLRAASRDISTPVPNGTDLQSLLLARGTVMQEITRRLQVEAEELDSLERSNMGFILGQLGFVNFLATPSYAFVNAMQNLNVALPVITARYGLRGAKALTRGMRVVAGPAFAKAIRGLFSRPGEVTSYDVYQAIAEAVKEDPRFGKFAVGDAKNPSALQQLVDRNVINASFVQELSAVANNQNLLVTRGLEYLRLLPQGSELWNRISTALAVLEVTNGNVNEAANLVDEVHFDYMQEQRPRFFRKIGSVRLPQAITMFKIYSVGMYQLTGALIADAASRRGQSFSDRRKAATALAGLIATHALSVGVIGSVLMEPLRALRWLWNQMFGDDDEFGDLDTMVQLWAAEVTGSEDAGRLLSRGLWNTLGFDLVSRMGLDRMLFYDPPESMDESDLTRTLFGLLGPLPSMMVQRASRAYDLAVNRGKPYEAVMEMIPVRLFQDARKAWKLANEGVTMRSGETIVDPSEFNWVDIVGTAAGFRTTEATMASEHASTQFKYTNWRRARATQLIGAYLRARKADDKEAQKVALDAIRRFNEKNPGAPITARAIKASSSGSRRAARERQGKGRNRDLNRLLEY